MKLEDVKVGKLEVAEDEFMFTADELYDAEPQIFELIEDGDFDGLQKFLMQVGGF